MDTDLISSDIVVSIVRVVTVTQIDYTDLGYSVVPAFIWALAEPAIAIIVACLPACRPLLSRLLPAHVRNTLRTGDKSYGKIEESGSKLVDRSRSRMGPAPHHLHPAAGRARQQASESDIELAETPSSETHAAPLKSHAIVTDESA